MPIRDLQVRFAEVGRIRLGRMDPGERSPTKHETFRLTSPTRELVEEAARLYGGEVGPWTPQGSKAQQWEVLTEATAIPVYVPQQTIDPWMEKWGKGYCQRRCDGEHEALSQQPCLCKAERLNPRGQHHCRPTVRVQVMLAELQGLVVWRLESHGWYACSQLGQLAPFIANAPMPVPARLTLTKIPQRRYDATDKKVITQDIIVPAIIIDAVSARQVAIGGDALTQALAAAGAPAAIAAPATRAIEAPATAPATAPPARPAAPAEPPAAPAERVGLMEGELERILAAIEGSHTLAHLQGIGEGLRKRQIRNRQIEEAWTSKQKAIKAADEIGGSAVHPDAQHRVGDTVQVGELTFTKVGEDPFEGEPTEAEREFAAHEQAGAPMDDPKDVNEEYNLIHAAAGPLGWSTADTNDRIKRFCQVGRVQDANAVQLRLMRHAMKRGEIT